MPILTLQEYLNKIRAAYKLPGAHGFYFPANAQRRKSANLRLARELGVGLAGYDSAAVENVLATLYSTMIVAHSLDRTGVQIDNREFLAELRAAIENQRAKDAARARTASYPI